MEECFENVYYTSKHRLWDKRQCCWDGPKPLKVSGIFLTSLCLGDQTRCLLVHSSSIPITVGFQRFSNFTVTKLPFSEETVGGTNLPSTVALTEKEATMRKVKLIVHETYQGKHKYASKTGNIVIFPVLLVLQLQGHRQCQ